MACSKPEIEIQRINGEQLPSFLKEGKSRFSGTGWYQHNLLLTSN
jgi:hypothetical protein